jgi:YaiO family outer membrane protein
LLLVALAVTAACGLPAPASASEAPPPIPREERVEAKRAAELEREEAAGSAPSETENTDYDFELTTGPFFANFSDGYGHWFGLHTRAWLLDVTGKRRFSGYVEVVNLRWNPDEENDPTGLGQANTDFAAGRVLKYWTDEFYTFLTLGGSVGDTLFPRVQIEAEANYIVPQHRALVLAFGGGYRQYDPAQRPFVVMGGAYSLPRAAVLYRIYSGAGIARERSTTHLLTFVYGERLSAWLRADFLWGDESHPAGRLSTALPADVDSRAASLTWEQWIQSWYGTSLKVGVSDSVVLTDLGRSHVRRLEGELRLFATF